MFCPSGRHAIEDARFQVQGPAIGLLVAGILNWLATPLVFSLLCRGSPGLAGPCRTSSVQPGIWASLLLLAAAGLAPAS